MARLSVQAPRGLKRSTSNASTRGAVPMAARRCGVVPIPVSSGRLIAPHDEVGLVGEIVRKTGEQIRSLGTTQLEIIL